MDKQRSLMPSRILSDGTIEIKGRVYIDFSSNDYLGLSRDACLLEMFMTEQRMGATGSRLLSGDHPLCHDLERQLADWLRQPSVLVFNTGYQMNLGVISTLWGPSDVIFMDRLVHASMVDGVRLSGARFYRYRHNDIHHLESLLMRYRTKGKRAVILTESVFSMDGDRSDLIALVSLKQVFNCELYVDEAHAIGVFGPEGSGLVRSLSLESSVDYIVGTFGKSFGSMGAFLGCSHSVKQQLIHTCRSFIYSTALPLPIISWNLLALKKIKKMDAERCVVLDTASYFRDQLKNMNFIVYGDTHIIPVIFGEASIAMDVSKCLERKGYWVPPIRTPTVPEKLSRLRFSLTFFNKNSDFLDVVDSLSV